MPDRWDRYPFVPDMGTGIPLCLTGGDRYPLVPDRWDRYPLVPDRWDSSSALQGGQVSFVILFLLKLFPMLAMSAVKRHRR